MNISLIQEYPYTGASESSMLDKPLIVYGIAIVTFLIGIFITRAIFSIGKFLKHQKAQTTLLMYLARKNGLPDHEFNLIKETIEPDETKINQTYSIKEIVKGF